MMAACSTFENDDDVLINSSSECRMMPPITSDWKRELMDFRYRTSR
jgi:hypothetical protein